MERVDTKMKLDVLINTSTNFLKLTKHMNLWESSYRLAIHNELQLKLKISIRRPHKLTPFHLLLSTTLAVPLRNLVELSAMLLHALGPDIFLAVLLLVVYFSNHSMELGRTKLFPRVPGPHVGGEVLLGVGEIAAREGATNLNLILGIVVLKVRYQGGGTGEGSFTIDKIAHEFSLGVILLNF